jgi:hypothetical protein
LSGIIFFGFVQRQSAFFIFKALFLVGFLSLPLWIHQIHYLSLIRYSIAAESRFVHINIVVLISGCLGIGVLLRRKGPYYLILGLIIGFSLVFIKYFYRYFAAQGFLPWSLAASAWCAAVMEYAHRKTPSGKIHAVLFLAVWALFFFFTPTFALDDLKPSFLWTDSTFNNYSSGDLFQSVPYNTIYSQRYFRPIEEVILRETDAGAIITSNSSIVSVMAAALTNRFTADALFREVKPIPAPGLLAEKQPRDTYAAADVVVWIKSEESLAREFYVRAHHLTALYENELFVVYRSLDPKQAVRIPRSKYPFWLIYFVLFCVCFAVCARGVLLLRRA